MTSMPFQSRAFLDQQFSTWKSLSSQGTFDNVLSHFHLSKTNWNGERCDNATGINWEEARDELNILQCIGQPSQHQLSTLKCQ